MQVIQATVLMIGVFFAHSVSAKLKCDLAPANVPTDWISMVDKCKEKMEEQVNIELTAAMTYMAMGAHFAKDTVNRPGFSKIFFESASEERDHAIQIMSYLLMRGELTSELTKLIRDPHPPENAIWDNGVQALTAALELETSVTDNIRDIIKFCETPGTKDFNDYHLVDHLTGVFLEEQYLGQRELAGKISTLDKMMKTHGAVGEFLFDKKLLNGEPL